MPEAIGLEVLAFLAINGLDPTPTNYRLGYLYLTQGSQFIVEALQDYVDNNMRIRKEYAENLMVRYKDEEENPLKTELSNSNRAAVGAYVQNVVTLAKQARKTAGSFQKDIARDHEIIKNGATGHDLGAAVLRIVQRTEAVERELAESENRIKRLQRDLEEAQNEALIDELTGLPNRRAARHHMESLDQEQGLYSVAIVDIDFFKNINDRLGHPVGDRLITLIGKTLEDQMSPDIVARWGGEEFLIISRENTLGSLHKRLDQARQSISQIDLSLRETDQKVGKVTVSAGATLVNGNPEESIEIADALLYECKQNGRDQVRSAELINKAA